MTSAATCLTCFAELAPGALSKGVVHSCCSRPICATCLLAMPRLATFCPFCEGVNHALRKGPRRDVIRAGQVVFDMDSAVMESERDSGAPPAYTESQEPVLDANFVLAQGGEEGDDDDGDVPRQHTPHLLQASRLGSKQAAVHAGIDRSKSATISPSVPSPSGPSVESLRRSLSKDGNYTTCVTGRSSGNSVPQSSTASQKKARLHSQPRAEGSRTRQDTGAGEDAGGLTRQYWLRPNDTLVSLCLRFKVNAAVLCKLNDLPLSTANTTPHLIHTRSFLLIPEDAIQSALSSTSGDVDSLQSALDGPVAQSRKQKIQRARREAQSRFRVIITKNESLAKGKGRGDNGDSTLCDDRAAKAYISLMEDELQCIDFGDTHQQTKAAHDDDEEEQDAAIDASRKGRFNVIVKQAVCRWEMDSDWERKQRRMGFTPVEAIACGSTTGKHRGAESQSSWLKRLTAPSGVQANRAGWMEKAR